MVKEAGRKRLVRSRPAISLVSFFRRFDALLVLPQLHDGQDKQQDSHNIKSNQQRWKKGQFWQKAYGAPCALP